MKALDPAPPRARVAAQAAPLEAELEALFREVRRDAALAVSGAADPRSAIEAVGRLLDAPIDVGEARDADS